ncbi:conserved hypothetical Ustilaginaceae-specific protein [Sporisorium reilianum SRZ2]|uniref:Conserved hypothetical Ustilaginaceae-specific protein n=1 Tax=Sporisorium reilianum (strain SRZ2) TaxID=999809 RepID=E6ZQL4_SPORE|nr:conserved hypothetical Ustilaginaceae-specific protein [Sporisorium reilianum SRZ2]
MPGISAAAATAAAAAAAVAVPATPSGVASRIVQLFRGPTHPVDFPASIVSGLSSMDPSVQRAAIAELRAYIKRCFFLPFEPYFYINNLVTAGLICLLILIGLPVAGHRLYHGRLNPVRVERRAQGSYLVPNAINCFLLLEGAYGAVTVGFNFIVWQLFDNKQAVWIKLFQAARSLVWIPLYIGAFLTGWGSFYTAPGALDKPTAARNKTSAKGHLPWPMIVNLSCWGVPVALVVSLLPPVCLSSVKMTRTYHDFVQWDQRFEALLSSTVTSAVVDQAAVNDLRSQAYAIFTNWTRSYYYIDIGFVLWGFWALLFLVFYVPAGGVLVYLLYRQVVRQRGILLSYQQKLEAQLAQETRHTHVSVLTSDTRRESRSRGPAGLAAQGRSRPVWSAVQPSTGVGAPLEDIYEDRGASDDSRGTGRSGGGASCKSGNDVLGLESALRQEPPASVLGQGGNSVGITSRTGAVASLAAENDEATNDGSPTVVPKSPSAFRRLIRLDTKTSSHRGGQTSSRSVRRKRISITGGPMSRYKYLRRCLINLVILYLGIISAACFFGAITIYLAAVEYESALRGPDSVVHMIAIAGSTAAWVSAVFGGLTIGSIIFRNFDVPQPEASQNSGEGGGNGDGNALRRRFNRNASSGTGSGGDEQGAGVGGGHEKTRTLPAVPESVDLEASMMSMVQSRPRMAMNTAMKFAMAEQSSRPGGFVISPDDQLASTLSANAPDMEERRDVGYESFGRVVRVPPRVWAGREREATMSIPQDVTESYGLLSMVGLGSNAGRGRVVDPGEDAQGHFRSNDTTLAEYPSFDPRVIRAANGEPVTLPRRGSVASPPESTGVSPKVAQVESSPAAATASPVLKRLSRRKDSAGGGGPETPASKIAREWAQSQYVAAPLPEPPVEGGASDDTAWVGELEGSPPASPSPWRPMRDVRRGLAARGEEL